ncbi:MAG: Obg family GTPase CgtA, partial [Armatimonadetes bacterium]|nr:Obg family GTPase CgtA [Armatimonadota bacterium]
FEGRDPLQDRDDINRELELYKPELAELEQIIALNKMDLPQARENLPELRARLEAEGLAVFPISAATGEGTEDLVNHLRRRLAALGHEAEVEPPEELELEIPPLPFRELSVQRVSDDVIVVTGTRVEKLAATTDMEADESLNWFQRQLEQQGVLKALREAGAEEGDTIIVGDVEFFYTLSPSEETERRLQAEEREGGLGD